MSWTAVILSPLLRSSGLLPLAIRNLIRLSLLMEATLSDFDTEATLADAPSK